MLPYIQTYIFPARVAIYVGIYVTPRIYANIHEFFYMFHICLFRMEVGDQVYYFCPRKRLGVSPKWQNLFTGPYTVLKVIDRYNYMITRRPTAKPMVVHRDKLKIYFSSPAAPISGLDNPYFAAPLSGLDTTAMVTGRVTQPSSTYCWR
jgi:hypothetical protein